MEISFYTVWLYIICDVGGQNVARLIGEKMDILSPKQVVQRFNHEVIEQGNRASFDALVASDFVNWSAPAGAPSDGSGLWNTFEHVLRPALSGLKVQIHDQITTATR